MSEFVKLSKIDNQSVILNLNSVVYFGKTANGTEIKLTNSERIEVRIKFEDLQDLLTSNDRMVKNLSR